MEKSKLRRMTPQIHLEAKHNDDARRWRGRIKKKPLAVQGANNYLRLPRRPSASSQ